MGKKMIAALLSLCLLCSFVAVTASAADSVDFRVDVPDSVVVGQTFTVTVSVSEVADGRGVTAKLNYDQEALEFVSAAGENGAIVHHKVENSRVNLVLEKIEPTTFSGTLMTVTFQAKAITDSTSLSLTDCVASYGQGSETNSYPSGVENAAVTIAPRPLGDVTCDGEVTATDYSRLLAHVKKVSIITDEATLEAADVTGDGKITATDYSRLLAHVKKVSPLW